MLKGTTMATERHAQLADEIRKQLKVRCSPEDFKLLQDRLELRDDSYKHGMLYYEFGALELGREYVIDAELFRVAKASEHVASSLVLAEYGGYNTEEMYGNAQTVCGVTGKALRPFYVADVPGKVHGLFAVEAKAVVCQASRHTDQRLSLQVIEAKLDYDPETGVIRFNLINLFSGSRFNEAPRRYTTALAFAIAKAITPYSFGAVYVSAE